MKKMNYTPEAYKQLWIEIIEKVKNGEIRHKVSDIAVLHGESWNREMRNLDTEIIYELYASIPSEMRTVAIIDSMMWCALEKYTKKFVAKHGTQPEIAIGTVGHVLTQLQAEIERLCDNPVNWHKVFERLDAIQLTL